MKARLVAIGRLSAPHGKDGLVTMVPLTEVPGNFRPGMAVFLAGERPRWSRLQHVEHGSGRKLVVALDGIASREDALAAGGYAVQISREDLADPPSDTYYVMDLVGMRVETVDGQVLGLITDIAPGPANDVMVVEDEVGRQVLLPMISDVITAVDRDLGLCVVRPWEGMVE